MKPGVLLLLGAVVVVGGGVAAYVASRPPQMIPYVPPELAELKDELGNLIRSKLAEADADRTNVGKQVDYALSLHFNNRFRDALPNLVSLERMLPGDPLPLIYQGHCYREFGDTEKAEAIYADTAVKYPTFAPAHHERGRLALERGDLDLAEKCFAESARLAPEKFNGWLGLGDVAVRRRDFAKAREHLEKASRLAPDDKTCLYQLGLALRGLGLKAEAERKLAAGSGANSKKMSEAWGDRQGEFSRSASDMIATAISLVKRGRVQDGIMLLERLYADDPANIEILNNLSAAYQDAKQHGKAKELLEKALARDPGRDATLVNLSSLHINMGDPKKALEYAEQAIKVAPSFASAHFNKGNALMRLGRAAEATAAYAQAIKYEAKNGRVHCALAAAYIELKKPESARRSLETGLALEPDYLPGRIFQIEVLIGLGDRPGAEAAFAAASKLAPGHPDLQRFKKALQ